MECNKDEALKAKSIAEDKLHKRDFIGARKFATKAKDLYPQLDGINQMLTTIDVYVYADQNKINGEVDWYDVLGVNPSVDDVGLKKQYRKLALMIHPDKNKTVGADGAFVLISDAFGVLSDKARRFAYNQRRGIYGVPPQRKTTTSKFQTKSPPSPAHKAAPTPATKPTSPRPGGDTFWTSCSRWREMYLNYTFPFNKAFTAFVVVYFTVVIIYAKQKSAIVVSRAR